MPYYLKSHKEEERNMFNKQTNKKIGTYIKFIIELKHKEVSLFSDRVFDFQYLQLAFQRIYLEVTKIFYKY